MITIDADSHFTRKVMLVKEPPELALELIQLIEKHCLCFGHWEIGDQHNTFVVLLRAMHDAEITLIFRSLKDACNEHFKGQPPDLVIFPGESTAIHLALRFAMELKALGNSLVVSPEFRAYGKHSLRLEISDDHLTYLHKKESLNILFFDDSLSSGDTESHVLEAFIQERKNKSEPDKWLSYSVLWRGQHLIKDLSESKREIPKLVSDPNEFIYTFQSFGVIGPRSLSRANCPLCRASQHIHNAILWARGARPAVRKKLEKIDDLLRSRPIEHLTSNYFYLDPKITQAVLRLSAMQMTEVCVYIWKRFIQRTLPSSSCVEEELGVLIFTALHYADVGCYITSDSLISLIKTVEDHLDLDSQAQCEAFLIACSIFPPSTLVAVAPALVLKFASCGAVDMGSVLLALTFSSQHDMLLNYTTLQDMSVRHDVLIRRSCELVEFIKEGFEQGSPELKKQHEIVMSDLAILSCTPQEKNPAWVARTLAALLHRGGHPSFLSEQIKNLSKESVEDVRHGLIQALGLMQQLPLIVVGHLEDEISRLLLRIKEFKKEDIEQCRELVDVIMGTFWRREIYKTFFLSPKVLDENLRQSTTEVVSKYSETGIRTNNFFFLECDSACMAREAFGPNLSIVKNHFENLLKNPVKHFPLETFKITSEDPPLLIGYIKQDEKAEKLVVVIADRAQSPDQSRLFGLSHGLAHHRANLEMFGGNLEYMKVPDGAFESSHPPTDIQKESFIKKGWDPSIYKNIFVTTFPLILKGV